jgi:hypothetical protein
MSASYDPIVTRLMDAPYGHLIHRDDAGNSHVTLYDAKDQRIVTIVAPTFDEAVTRALDIADEMHRPTPPTPGVSE